MGILGVDEVGRGPLAGPLVVGAVILPDRRPRWVAELRDSKQLTPKQRERLAELIWREASAVGLGWIGPRFIDEYGMNVALRAAALQAVRVAHAAKAPFGQIIIDGNMNLLVDTPFEPYTSTLIKGDDLIKEVSAASIVAKVARDAYMRETGRRYPGYGFEQHMGYGTPQHRAALQRLGLTPEHRRSFQPCKRMCGFNRAEARCKNTTKVGEKAEIAVREWLKRQGHMVIGQNFKTYWYEIDLVSLRENKIYFTEVKYRRDGEHGGGLAAITKVKQKQMRFAAECFMRYYDYWLVGKPDPLLAVAAVTGEECEEIEWMALGE